MKTWRVSRNGDTQGPFSEAQVFEQIGRATLGRGHYVSYGDGPWIPIEEAHVFRPALPPPAVVVHYAPPPNYQYHQPIAPGYMVAPVWSCPKCRGQGGTYLKTKVTTAGWVMFFIGLFSCVLFPLIFIGLSTKENVMFCKSCNCRL